MAKHCTAKLSFPRRFTREVPLGHSGVVLGGQNPVRVQSMTATLTADIKSTLRQIGALQEAGCEIVRVTVNSLKAIEALPAIRARFKMPLVADIHFDHRLAVLSAPYVDKIRINPGNIGNEEHIAAVVAAAKQYDLAIRVGVNAGSLEREIALSYGAQDDGTGSGLLRPPEGGYPAQALVDSALHNIKILEAHNFYNTVISVKASHVPLMTKAYRSLARECDYPLHLGVTEAGTFTESCIKSAMGIGSLLLSGIGDTLRVSIAGRSDSDKVSEVTAGFRVLRAAGIRPWGVEVIACPSCGRQQSNVNTPDVARAIEQRTAQVRRPLRVAVMGCAVNGPGEAADADLALIVAGETMQLYKKGMLVQSGLSQEDAVDTLVTMIERM
ncbi:flavodoxin-dependent (E)-4-hydroxy-3-methylbut-2-enyl-diphosphate synthase [Candidatus Sumerlaeota bacterium]|nr:flavodoxin-dependent (E)-4-hydroxy-3-methylbut-2-enyl-diphosphate synthase [Candidatus Sumerlaeales bacterium]NLD61263.1 flavodoxin-dependent (E)-4-hydroxy-3-methylbut-2-enyl-diphosphate synthase [Candidatus Sumerlaeota bacterium]